MVVTRFGSIATACVLSCAAPVAAQTKTDTEIAWAWKTVPGITVNVGSPIPISAAVGSLPMKNVKVAHVALLEKRTGEPISGEQMKLCPATGACAETVPELKAKSHTALLLKSAENAGQYEGTITLVSDERFMGEAVAMKVNVTSTRHQILGVGAIFLGLVLAWIGTVLTRHRLDRNALLMPATLLTEEINRVLEAISRPGPRLPNTVGELKALHGFLTFDVLEKNGLPGRIPPFTGTANAALNAEKLRAHLQRISDRFTSLQVICGRGRMRLLAKAPANGEPGPEWKRAELDLDELAKLDPLPPAGVMVDQVDQVIATVPKPAGTGMRTAGHPAHHDLSLPSSRELRFEIASYTLAGWLFLGTAVMLAGAYIVVLSNPGFGTPVDFFLAVLWGLGLPAGTQLAGMTTGSVIRSFDTPK